MVYKKFYGVEYYTDDNSDMYDSDRSSTFEIFATKKDADKFSKSLGKDLAYTFVADFNMKYVYKEEGSWNYDDNASLYKGLKVLVDKRSGYKPDTKQKIPSRSGF